MKLLEAAPAPNCRRLRMFLAEKGVDIPTEQVDIQKGEQYSPEYKAKNPFSGVPVLEMDDGTFLAESIAICRYFEALHPEPALFGSDAKDQALVEMWQRRMEMQGLMAVGMAFRHSNEMFKDLETQVAEWAAINQKRAEKFFRYCDKHLGEATYVAGEAFTVADITLLCTTDFAKLIGFKPNEAEYPNLTRWHTSVSARPSAQA